MISVADIRRQIRRHLINPRQPLGIVNPRYVAPHLSDELRVHRSFLVGTNPAMPRPIAWAVFVWQWLRWSAFYGWRNAERVVRANGEAIREKSGIGLISQRASVLYLALVHNIPPLDYYRFRFFNTLERQRIWSYVFDNEAAAFHRWRSGTTDTDEATKLLSDKQAFAEALTGIEIRVAETIRLLPAGSDWRSLPDTAGELQFCKPRVGSSARGVFRYSRTGDQLDAWQLNGQEIEPDRVLEYIDARLGVEECIVQPLYENHPDLDNLAARPEAITLRLITEMHGESVVPYCAYLEVPVVGDSSAPYVPLTVDVGTGAITAIVFDYWRKPGQMLAESLRTLELAADGVIVPSWQELIDSANAAHRTAASVFAIAWDFVVTAQGPVLLEGNTTWSMIVPQQICGPLLASEEQK
jgi:hypothetical protein